MSKQAPLLLLLALCSSIFHPVYGGSTEYPALGLVALLRDVRKSAGFATQITLRHKEVPVLEKEYGGLNRLRMSSACNESLLGA